MKQCRSCGVEKPFGEYYPRNPDCKVCACIKRKQDYAANKDKYRDRLFRKNYGIGLDDYNAMFAEQEGCCAICGTHQCTSGRMLAVDHDHETKHVRGLLCANCNTALGKFHDNQDLLYRAADYLRFTAK